MDDRERTGSMTDRAANPWREQGPQARRCYASELLLRAEAAREREQAAEMRANG